jgi:hypothetical protein
VTLDERKGIRKPEMFRDKDVISESVLRQRPAAASKAAGSSGSTATNEEGNEARPNIPRAANSRRTKSTWAMKKMR